MIGRDIDLKELRKKAQHEPGEVCARCGLDGGWVVLKGIPGKFHVLCSFHAEAERQVATKQVVATEIGAKARRRIDRAASRFARLIGRD